MLLTPSEIPRVPRAHISALKIAHEDPDLVVPVVDLACGKVFEPCPHRVHEVQREVAVDHGVVCRAAQLASQAIVVGPEPGIGLSRVLGECGGLTKAWGERSGADFSAEHTGARRLQ